MRLQTEGENRGLHSEEERGYQTTRLAQFGVHALHLTRNTKSDAGHRKNAGSSHVKETTGGFPGFFTDHLQRSIIYLTLARDCRIEAAGLAGQLGKCYF